MRRTATVVVFVIGCLPEVDSRRHPDAGAASAFVILDGLGRSHAPDDVPERPRFLFERSPAELYLLVGALDPPLLDDLARAPLTDGTLRRALPLWTDGAITFRPSEPLPAGGHVVLVTRADVASPYLATPLVVMAVQGGATLTGAFPPVGSIELPTNTSYVDLRFDDAVSSAETLRVVAAGLVLGSSTSTVPCAQTGLGEGACVRVTFDAPFPARTTVALDLGSLHDRFGDALIEQPTFTTAEGPSDGAPVLMDAACALDERTTGFGCLLVRDSDLALRAFVNTEARVELTFGSTRVVALTSFGGMVATLSGLAPDTTDRLVVVARSLAGTEDVLVEDVRTAPPLAGVRVDEVRADPNGPEPAQEYVELWNSGRAAVELAGFTLADAADRIGDVLPAVTMAPGTRALVVADSFSAGEPSDLSPPAGVMLVRIGASLGSGGLANAGEPLFLRDDQGRRLDAWPAVGAREGRCTWRTGAGTVEEAACSPGLPTRE